jgi:hypothetical protein
MQVRTDKHMNASILMKQTFESNACIIEDNEDSKKFFKLFQESTFEGSRAAALEMKRIAKRHYKSTQHNLLAHSLYVLAHSDSGMLSWPNSPLLVLLHFVDLNMLSGDEDARGTPLHDLTDLAAPSDFSTHVNQLILAKQLIEHGASVNAVSRRYGCTPLHTACFANAVTNLDFVELLLNEGADANAQDCKGRTPLMVTTPDAPGAAKFLLNWPTTDFNITTRSGDSFLARVRNAIEYFSEGVARPGQQLLLRQWREIEEMLVERGAIDTDFAERNLE